MLSAMLVLGKNPPKKERRRTRKTRKESFNSKLFVCHEPVNHFQMDGLKIKWSWLPFYLLFNRVKHCVFFLSSVFSHLWMGCRKLPHPQSAGSCAPPMDFWGTAPESARCLCNVPRPAIRGWNPCQNVPCPMPLPHHFKIKVLAQKKFNFSLVKW